MNCRTRRGRQFQSTLPVGGATVVAGGGTAQLYVSIHAPRGGSDLCVTWDTSIGKMFQSTLPVGGATILTFVIEWVNAVSIHAPRGGSDCIITY